jgi:hypothetical protein
VAYAVVKPALFVCPAAGPYSAREVAQPIVFKAQIKKGQHSQKMLAFAMVAL